MEMDSDSEEDDIRMNDDEGDLGSDEDDVGMDGEGDPGSDGDDEIDDDSESDSDTNMDENSDDSPLAGNASLRALLHSTSFKNLTKNSVRIVLFYVYQLSYIMSPE